MRGDGGGTDFCAIAINLNITTGWFVESSHMKAGDVVKYSKPVDSDEAELRFVLLAPPEKGKVDIQLVCDFRIKPVRIVTDHHDATAASAHDGPGTNGCAPPFPNSFMNAESKVTPQHLKRAAYLYIRQSSLRQVLENTESTERQYALRRRAIALGWHEEQIVVIDHDQGHSGASTVEREGFQRLVADVGLGKAGIVMGLEVSRLARNCADWHRLLEICALSQSLILDEDGLYDPAHFNDRLLLGLKGTMSEAELHVLKARLIGGMLNKAQRAELAIPLPIGLIYDEDQRVILDPDQQVQHAMRLFFETFKRVSSAWATVQYFHQQGLSFPRRGRAGSGEVAWQQLTYNIALDTLHNPRYAGAFCFGRTKTWKDVAGKIHCQELPREQWRFLQKHVHPGYISWEQYRHNQAVDIGEHRQDSYNQLRHLSGFRVGSPSSGRNRGGWQLTRSRKN